MSKVKIKSRGRFSAFRPGLFRSLITAGSLLSPFHLTFTAQEVLFTTQRCQISFFLSVTFR